MSDDSTPIPVRFWWLKRLSIAGAIAIVALVGLRWYWGYEMNRRLEAAVAAIEAKGEPIRFDDMKRPPVPDADNKAYYLRQALTTWPRINGLLITETNWFGAPDRYDDPITDNAAYLKQCEPVFDLLRQAQAAPESDWPAHSMISLGSFPLAEMRALAYLVDDAVQRAHEAGRPQLSLHLIELQLSMTDAFADPPKSLLMHVVGLSIEETAVTRIQRLLPTQPVEKHGDAADATRRLIARFLDDDAHRQAVIDAMIGERWIVYQRAVAILSGQQPPSQVWGGGVLGRSDWLTWALAEPLLTYDTVFLLNTMTLQRNAIESETLVLYNQYADAHFPEIEAIVDGDAALHPISTIVLPLPDRVARYQFQHLANLRMAATALAIKQYEADHGKRPASLDELVPRYLAAVPLDPFAADGRAIGYRPGDAVPWLFHRSQNAATAIPGVPPMAVLYCVGVDGVDDGGELLLNADYELADESNRGLMGWDQIYPLDPLPEPTSTQQRGGNQPQPGD